MLREAKVPAGPINGVDEAFALAEELGMEPVAEVDGVPLIRPPLRIDGERPPIRHRPPRLGEHDDDLRAWPQIGWTWVMRSPESSSAWTSSDGGSFGQRPSRWR